MTRKIEAKVEAPGRTGPQPSPAALFDVARSYQNSYILKAGVDLDVFTSIAKGNHTAPEIAKACGAAERGARILCDALTVLGFLAKSGNTYALTPDSAAFLDSRSPAYLGKAFKFLMHPLQMKHFEGLSEAVRKGEGGEHQTLEAEDPIWVDFARGMAPLMLFPAQAIAAYLYPLLKGKAAPKVLDIAAGHGMFGVTVAEHVANAQIYAVDWPGVLEVARDNARARGVGDRHYLIPGSAFEVEYGSGYHAVLLTNFLHHFDVAANERLLQKLWKAMNPGAHLVILEFVPNGDRVSPPVQALFSVTMLSNTPAGDAYTFAELKEMCANAGFADAQLLALEGMPQSLVMARKP